MIAGRDVPTALGESVFQEMRSPRIDRGLSENLDNERTQLYGLVGVVLGAGLAAGFCGAGAAPAFTG